MARIKFDMPLRMSHDLSGYINFPSPHGELRFTSFPPSITSKSFTLPCSQGKLYKVQTFSTCECANTVSQSSFYHSFLLKICPAATRIGFGVFYLHYSILHM